MRICIDGNIGVGKSTILGRLKDLGYKVFPEPIDEWPLDLFYSDPSRWGFTLQLAILKNQRCTDGIHERCAKTSRDIFWQAQLNAGSVTDTEDMLYRFFVDKHGWEPDIHIVLRAPPEHCLRNIHKRTQTGDTSVTLEYLETIDRLYTRLIENNPWIRVVDATDPIEIVLENVRKFIDT
jgi:deoxyadenosine/deoxycytidine kinase